MKQLRTEAIVLRRVNYGEADRIITFLTPGHGKISAIAKGVRKPKSKLGGALEPFSESTITFGQGRGELRLVFSTRLETFYGNILTDYERLQLGYEAITQVDRTTEDVVESHFYELLRQTFFYLNKLEIAHGVTELWFRMQLEELLGRSPDLQTDVEGNKLQENEKYSYDVYERGLRKNSFGELTANHIKLLRLARSNSPAALQKVEGANLLLKALLSFVRSLG